MASLLYLVILFYQTVSTDAECAVIGCNSTFCDGDRCTQCNNAYFSHTDSCRQCYLYCRRCNGNLCYKCISASCNYASKIEDCPLRCPGLENVACPNCPDGFYKYSTSSHCFRCLNTGCKCSSDVGCIDCLPGRYDTASNCEHTCPRVCITCTSITNCSECVTGKYGPACESNCISQCRNGSCDKISGICPSRCSDNWYLDTNLICRECRSRCSSCTDFSSCSACASNNYWGPKCEWDCLSCSGNCTKDDGCLTCYENYYRSYNGTLQGHVCKKCPDSCLTCDSATDCKTCKNGYWGQRCQFNCTGCSKMCDKDYGCTTGCSVGFFQSRTQNRYHCISCINYCEICHSETDCLKCFNGYYPRNNETCISCSDKCKDKKCDQFTGSCLEGCMDRYAGELCDNRCLSNCLICQRYDSDTCISCESGFYGDKCHQCSQYCKQEIETQRCYEGNGTCKYGCETGYWGAMCTEKCINGCQGSHCNQSTGACLNGCSATYYGELCTQKCSPNCAIKSKLSRQCDEIDGSCRMGCKSGFYGIKCSFECRNCKNVVCFQQNGTCEFGCTDGFTGGDCMENTESLESPLSGDNGSETNVGVYAGAAAGAVAVIAIVVVTILLLKRRRASNKKEPQDDRLSLESVSGNFGKGENTYATITDSKTNDEVENIPEAVTVISSKVSLPIRTRDPGMANGNGAVISKESGKEAPKGLSEKDTISDDLSDLKEELSTLQYSGRQDMKVEFPVEKADNQVWNVDDTPDKKPEVQSTEDNVDEEGNTYYNTIGKRVAVSDLADNIRKRDYNMLMEEFNKLPRGLLKDHNAAKQQRNASKNRYKMIYPYDESRVILNDGANDYVNASFIQGYNKPKEYIGSSGPFQRGTHDNGTVADFWRMVWQEKCETIVMLTKCFENKEHKCEQYWPELGQSKEYAKLNVSCVTEDQYADFTIRSFVVIKDGQTLNSRHLHFTAWPDKGVPADVTSMIEYRQKVRSLHKDAKSPMLVHCSAGIGRTGTFIALDMLTFMGEARGYVDMFGCVANLRFHRTNLVQTPEQYEYLHHAILHALTFDCKSITGEKFIETYSRLIKKKDGKSQLETQFQKLQSTIDEMSVEDKAAVNRNKALVDKNREGADIPGDENRVRLFENRKASASDYVNALFINGFRSRNKFIAAQTPLPATVIDFLSLIFQVKCSCVVMTEETDLQDKTVGVYWPADNQVIKHGVFQVACKESKTTSSYTVKTLSVKRKVGKKEEELDVSLFIYTNWPKDAAVPKSSDSLIQLVKDVDTKNNRQGDEKPILIHCMTGAERSCLYCAVSVLIEKMEIEHEVSVVNTLRQIKARRRSSIPTLDQYKFCHQAVISYIQTFDIYSNFGLKSK